MAPDSGFDPLAYWINGAHTRGIELHAWINPYRITRTTEEWECLSDTSPARQHPEWVVKYEENYYFDPALPEVRQLIVDSTEELLSNYNIDGIHLDDYFYPGPDFNDASSFALYGDDFTNIGGWRRDNVNQLVEALSHIVHQVNPNAEFGISPNGIWASSDLEPGGSANHSTNSSYRNQYADSKLWVENEWVDYIAPQIYWEIGHESADFTTLLNWWANLTEPFHVKLYIGLADYNTLEATSADNPWYNGEEISRQMASCHIPQVSGTIHFRYGSIMNSPALQQVLSRAFSINNFSAHNTP